MKLDSSHMQVFLTEGRGVSVIDVVMKLKGHISPICRLSLSNCDAITGKSSIETGYVVDEN